MSDCCRGHPISSSVNCSCDRSNRDSAGHLARVLHRTGLVVGPKKQLKSMSKPDRLGCAVAFVFFFVMTIVTVFSSKSNFIVVLFFAVCQLGSYVYYVLSYVPYGRKGAQKLAKMAFKVRLAPYRLALLRHPPFFEPRAISHSSNGVHGGSERTSTGQRKGRQVAGRSTHQMHTACFSRFTQPLRRRRSCTRG